MQLIFLKKKSKWRTSHSSLLNFIFLILTYHPNLLRSLKSRFYHHHINNHSCLPLSHLQIPHWPSFFRAQQLIKIVNFIGLTEFCSTLLQSLQSVSPHLWRAMAWPPKVYSNKWAKGEKMGHILRSWQESVITVVPSMIIVIIMMVMVMMTAIIYLLL